MNLFPEDKLRSMFNMAGITVLNLWELANQYWPRPQFEKGREETALHYAELCFSSPWWLVKTPYGLVEIGWRKRVIQISWRDTQAAILDLTADETTKNNFYVHAWSELKAIEYLIALRERLTAK